MKKLIIFLFFFPVISSVLLAGDNAPVVMSDFKKGEFITTVQVPVNASSEKIHEVMDAFISEYRYDLNKLFGWALVGLKLRGEKDDFIMFNLKSHIYDNASKQINGKMDIDVPFLRKNHSDITYTTSLGKKENTDDKQLYIQYEMIRCEKVISHVDAYFDIRQTEKASADCFFHVKIKLDRPYSLMSMKQYKENLEWRFAKFIANIKEEAEKK